MILFFPLLGDFFDQERRHEKDKQPSVFTKKGDSLPGCAKHKASDRAHRAGENGAYLFASFKPSPTFLPTVFIPFAAAPAPSTSILARTPIVRPTAVTTVARVEPCFLESSFKRSLRDLNLIFARSQRGSLSTIPSISPVQAGLSYLQAGFSLCFFHYIFHGHFHGRQGLHFHHLQPVGTLAALFQSLQCLHPLA